MSSKITYGEAVVQLAEMFPKIDVEVVKIILSENNNNIDRAIASLLILSGDESPELVKTANKGILFEATGTTEQELQDIEFQYGLNLHKTWHTRLPQDFLMFHYPKEKQQEDVSIRRESSSIPYYYGPGFIYYNPGETTMRLSKLGKSIKEKFKHYMNKRKGYQLTKTTED